MLYYQNRVFRLIIFADDIVLYSILQYNYSKFVYKWLQDEIDNLSDWLQQQQMQFSVDKTRYKVFYNIYIKRDNDNVDGEPELYLYTDPIIYQKKPIKYLGYYLSKNLNKVYHINYVIKKANFALYSTRLGLRGIKGVKAIIYFLIIKACVLSMLDYCSIMLISATKHELGVLRIFYNKVLRYLCNSNKHIPMDELHLFTMHFQYIIRLSYKLCERYRLLHIQEITHYIG